MNTSMSIALNSLIEPDRPALKPSAEKGRLDIIGRKTDDVLGNRVQPENASHAVELFLGKGGFMGRGSSPQGIRYFALPGFSLSVGGISLILQGNAITSNPVKKTAIAPVGEIKAQSYSHQAAILGAGLATRLERISGESTHYSSPAVPLPGNRSVTGCIANGLA
jgi:hypothetical protein